MTARPGGIPAAAARAPHHYCVLKDGSILGMGGKNTDIDGFMPSVVSRDGGKTWEKSKTVFPALGGNQRPSLLRLQSGRLFSPVIFNIWRGNVRQASRTGDPMWRSRRMTANLAHQAAGGNATSPGQGSP